MATKKHGDFTQEIVEKVTKEEGVKIALRAVIYSHVERWLGVEIDRDKPLPSMQRNALALHWQPSEAARDPVGSIMFAAQTRGRTQIKQSLSEIEAIERSLEALARAWGNLSYLNRLSLSYNNGGQTRTERVVAELGIEDVLFSTISLIENSVSLRKDSDNKALARVTAGSSRKGRAKNLAAHHVAEVLANFYLETTGKRPTYSDNQSGLHGDYTPALRDVFDAFGWRRTVLKGPAESAIRSISATQVAHVYQGSHAGILNALAFPVSSSSKR